MDENGTGNLKRAKKKICLSGKSFYLLGVGSLTAALILEILPIGTVLIFVPEPGRTIRETFSYFSLVPFGYAQFAALPTGILTAASVLLGIIASIRYNAVRKTKSAAFACSVLAAVCSLLPLLLYGRDFMAAASYVVFGTIVISICFQAIANRKS